METVNVKIEGDTKTLEIRTGSALPLREPVKIAIAGNIDSISRFLSKRKDTLEQKTCSITLDREAKSIVLLIDETSAYAGIVKGSMELAEAYTRFNINSGNEYSTFELADLFKMNRVHFERPMVAAKLITELNNFKAKVDKQVELSDDKRGNSSALIRQVVESNIPEKFNLLLPIFKGLPKQTIEVEVNINPSSLNCTLISPRASEVIDTITDQVIDDELAKFDELAPEIVIIEQ